MKTKLENNCNIEDGCGCMCENKIMNVRFINKSDNVDPVYTQGNSGFDLRANLKEPVVIPSMGRKLIDTGLIFEIPLDYELQVRSRSGLALKNGIMVLNSPGTVDSSYRGFVGIILYNTDQNNFVVNHGDRIAQGVICQVQQMQTTGLINVPELTTTERKSDGFGSSGIK
jgi:dUTP pyrophosphatase